MPFYLSIYVLGRKCNQPFEICEKVLHCLAPGFPVTPIEGYWQSTDGDLSPSGWNDNFVWGRYGSISPGCHIYHIFEAVE